MHTFRFATLADAPALRDFSERMFVTTYGQFNTPENLAMYVGKAFQIQQYLDDLSQANVMFIIAEENNKILAYCKLNIGKPLETNLSKKAIEISRFYVDVPFQGKGLAQELMKECLTWAQAQEVDIVWLAVWQLYPKAIRFYEKCGFHIVGTTTFILGTDIQDDYLMEISCQTNN